MEITTELKYGISDNNYHANRGLLLAIHTLRYDLKLLHKNYDVVSDEYRSNKGEVSDVKYEELIDSINNTIRKKRDKLSSLYGIAESWRLNDYI
jgi:hypothetical protein